MGSRIDIANLDELEHIAREKLIDGIIAGERFASIISGILQTAAAYGGDEAERSAYFPATVSETDFKELTRRMIMSSIDGMFDHRRFDRIISSVCMAGAAFGFQAVKQRENRETDTDEKAEALLAALLNGAKGKSPKVVPDDKAEEFFAHLLTLSALAAIKYTKLFLSKERLSFDTRNSPSFRLIGEKFKDIILGA